jgi:hypothetical protein
MSCLDNTSVGNGHLTSSSTHADALFYFLYSISFIILLLVLNTVLVCLVMGCYVWLLICTNIIPIHSSCIWSIDTHFFYSLIKLHYNPDFTKCEMLVPEGQWHIPGYISCSSPTFTSVPTYLCSSLG